MPEQDTEWFAEHRLPVQSGPPADSVSPAEFRRRRPKVVDPPPPAPPAVVVPAGPDGIDALDLIAKDLPPLAYVIPGLLSEGTNLLGGGPKIGKSLLAYQMAVEVALGGSLLDRPAQQGSVLYYALEDGERRGKPRLLHAMAGRRPARGALEMRWGSPKVGGGLEEDIQRWLDTHADARLVIVDTLQRTRPASSGRRNAYEVDMEQVGSLQSLFKDLPTALELVVHTNQIKQVEDLMHKFSGTSGIPASVDTATLVLRSRFQAFGTIAVMPRDGVENILPVEFSDMTWKVAADGLAGASPQRIEVYEVIKERGPIQAQAIADLLGRKRPAVANLIERLEGNAIKRVPNGYVVVPGHPNLTEE